MSEATKRKLAKYVPDPFVRDLLEAYGILYPHQVEAATNEDLERAGLRAEEIQVVRNILPAQAEVE